MAKVKSFICEPTLTIQLQLNEAEARALSGIFGYNCDAFLKVFYEKMGGAYVKPYEAGVRSLHETIREAMAGPLEVIDSSRRTLREAAQMKPQVHTLTIDEIPEHTQSIHRS